MMLDCTVLVPVEPTDILNNVEKMLLPRTMAESAVISIDFKRMKDMKNTHKSGCVRPVKMIKAIAYLKDIGNPYYKDVIIRCLFC